MSVCQYNRYQVQESNQGYGIYDTQERKFIGKHYIYSVVDANYICEWYNHVKSLEPTQTTDSVVLSVMQDLSKRSDVGLKKYKVSLDRNDVDLKGWLQHAYEECLDQANYLKRAIIEIESKEVTNG